MATSKIIAHVSGPRLALIFKGLRPVVARTTLDVLEVLDLP